MTIKIDMNIGVVLLSRFYAHWFVYSKYSLHTIILMNPSSKKVSKVILLQWEINKISYAEKKMTEKLIA